MGSVTISGDITGAVTGDPPNLANGDLDLTGGFALSANWSIATQPALGTATIDAAGQWTYTVDPSDYDDLDFGEIVEDTFTVRVTGNEVNTDFEVVPYDLTQTITITIEGVCFAAGTLLETDQGPRRIETLSVGDCVRTHDNGLQPVRWIESSLIPPERLHDDPSLRPVRIKRGSLGPSTPTRDLVVSQQHRILIRGAKVELLFGAPEVLVAAKHLCSWPGIFIDRSEQPVEYLHILMDRHEILLADGALAESLFLGDEALHTLSSDGLQELASIFPDRVTHLSPGFGHAARKILRAHEARALV